ncbi:MAG TPA: Re/Si-specific NAD(P)(+) transhydrogenase subunit alpha [Gemmatimonadaceae bacterium]|nr:Re/Si-specific NAD(P)(+) transhydrogenase subunit alpha [Gemmatimonadaceae bacterium]
MRIGVARETTPGERRVALVPESAARLVKAGVEVVVERDAGRAAFFTDDAYERAGATMADTAAVLGADVVLKVQRPTPAEVARMKDGAILISLLPVHTSADVMSVLAERGVSALALERVPRITRAQSMDILSSQATVAGYKAVLIAASHMGKLLPMLTTAAGSIPPAKAFVVGAGVAGLMAIATARRLGAVVSGFDIRAAAREQVLSLGATFVGPEPQADAEAAGGYARAQTEDEQQRTLAALASHVKDQDLVITTAQIPGRPAPRLITAEMIATMRPGAVIVDLAAESGGNCEVTRAGEIVDRNGVSIIGAVNVPSSVPYHASLMFSKNVLTLLQHLIKDGNIVLNLEDEITGPMCVVHAGAVKA